MCGARGVVTQGWWLVQSPEIDSMQTTKTTPYHCAELRRSVPVIQRIEWVSGIGQDDAEPVVLAEACALASRCPRVANCPLTAE